MKLLKIEEHQGYFLTSGGQYSPLDKITKEDLLHLVDLALEDGAEYDEFQEEELKNQAHQIIYKSIFGKLSALSQERDTFVDESKRLYLKEYEKYCGPSK